MHGKHYTCFGACGLHLIERGAIKRYGCYAVVAQLGMHIGEREVKVVLEQMGWDMESARVVSLNKSPGPGNVLTIEVESENITELFTGFGMRGVSAERVAQRTVEEAKRYLSAGVPVGPYLADQILLPMALAGSGSFRTVAPSQHTRTNIAVIEKFLDVQIECIRIADDVYDF